MESGQDYSHFKQRFEIQKNMAEIRPHTLGFSFE
jgi:hypothetical protein